MANLDPLQDIADDAAENGLTDDHVVQAHGVATRLAADAKEALDEYHARKPDPELAEAVQGLVAAIKLTLRSSGIYARTRLNHNLYYARDGRGQWEENLKPSGEFGDSIAMNVNVLRNLVRHMLSMVNSVSPTVQPQAPTTDASALDEAELCRNMLDHYFHAAGELKFVNRAVEHAPVLGVGYIHRFNDQFAGGLWAAPPADSVGPLPSNHTVQLDNVDDGNGGQTTVAKVYRGDIKHENVSLLDVMFDQSATSWEEVDEVVVRTYRNRYDLIAKYPMHASALKDARPRSTDKFDEYLPSPTTSSSIVQKSVAQLAKCEVWFYYHRRTAAVPDGRQLLMLPDGEVLESGPLEWDEIPLCRVAPEEMLGSVHTYAPVTSMGGMQEGLNIGASAIISNIAAYAKNVIIADKGSDIDPVNLTGDLKLLEVEFDEHGNAPVKVLELMKLPPELVNALQWIVGNMEQDAGVNSIVRGDPKGVTAGVAINLFQAMALQFASPLEEARAKAIQWMALGIIEWHQKHPDVPRDLQLVGKSKSRQLVEFYGNKIATIKGVDVDLGNPMSRTVAGRLQMLQALRQDGISIPPEKAMQVLNTGNLDVATEDISSEENLITAENEQLSAGVLVPARPGDDHLLHLKLHRRVASSPEMRLDPARLKALDDHEQMHVQLWMQGDLVLQIAMGGMPMGGLPPPGPPGAQHPPPPPGNHPPAPPPPHGEPPRGAPAPKGPDLATLSALKPARLPAAPPIGTT